MHETSPDISQIHFVASEAPEAQASLTRLTALYGQVEPDAAAVIVALGGDGLMLQTLHRHMSRGIPIYGMNRGSIGFLMNEYHEDDLLERLAAAETSVIHPLRMSVRDRDGVTYEALAINEVSIFRLTYQAAKLQILVDGKLRMEDMVCDGLLVATPAGSTAYNLSVYGPILPINAPLLALTPISPFRPRRWRGALLSNEAHVRINVMEPEKRPVAAVADHTEFRHAVRVDVREARSIGLKLMFDPGHAL
ncbi:MAG: NAD kinase, partial [Dichotomicrobium sp.]